MAANPKRVIRMQAIQELHSLGRQVLAEDKRGRAGHGGLYRVGSIAKVQELSAGSWSKGFLHTARLFAEAYRTQERLKWFLKLGTDQGKPLTRSHAIRLTTVKDGKLRDKLARQCAREGWSVSRLIEELQRVRGKRKYGGQRPARPRDATAALLDLERMSRRWIRWAAQLEHEDPNETDGGVTLKDLPDNVGTLLEKTRKPIAALGKAIREHLAASAEKKAKDAAGKRRSSVRRRPSKRVP